MMNISDEDMKDLKVKFSIRRVSSGAVSRCIDLGDGEDNSDSDNSADENQSTATEGLDHSLLGSRAHVPASTIADQALEKLIIENNIFLKAALQLLDQRDRSIEDSNALKDGSSIDVILSGKLKKASSGAVSRVWKDKHLELRHGVLTYEDYAGWGKASHKKSIQLIVTQVLCRQSTKYHGFVFEIRELDSDGHIIHQHNKKKLFMAETAEEMNRWISSIRAAMIGSAGDFGASNYDTRNGSHSGEDSHTVRSDESDVKALDEWLPLHNAQMGGSTCEESTASSSLQKKLFPTRVEKKRNISFASETENFNSDMKKFRHIKQLVSAADSPHAYRKCLLDQALDVAITIPVAHVRKIAKEFKSKCPDATKSELVKQEKLRIKMERKAKKKQGKKIRSSVFGNNKNVHDVSGEHMQWALSSRPTSIENSQAWKDLYRDSININGDLINGGVEGPEAMIGSLVRHILIQVQIMREKWVSNHIGTVDMDGSSTTLSDQDIAMEKARMMATTYSDLDEGQALSIAREVLLSCNRTESGGDTYMCVQSLLCNSEYAVLTPNGCDVDPIEIIVDVVESYRQRISQQGSHVDDNSTSVSPSTGSSGKKDASYPYEQYKEVERNVSSISHDPDDEGQIVQRDSTTVESEGSDIIAKTETTKTHYPDSLLDAAAAHVSQRGRRIGGQNEADDFYDPSELALKSDIPGASAIPSNMLLMKEVKRKKRMSRQDYIERSDSEDSMGTSGGESDKESDRKLTCMEKASSYDETVKKMLNSEEHHTDEKFRPLSMGNSAAPLYQINVDDATVAVSELTMDSAPPRRKGSITSSIRKNFGWQESSIPSVQSQSPFAKKRHSLFSWSSAKPPAGTPEPASGPNPPSSSGKNSYGSWRSGNDDNSKSTNRRHHHSEKSHFDEYEEEETAAQSMCVRIQVIVRSRYRLCNLDPQGDNEDTWARITGQFHQHFFLKSNSNGRPAVSDRFVTLKVDDPSLKYAYS